MMSPIVGYYGKLPLSPEFLRLHAAGPEVRWLDDWLQRGMLYAKSKEGPRWPALIAQSDFWNFLYVPSEQGRIVCGVLFASQDKAGRSFPFLTFQLFDRASLSGKPWLMPIVAAEFLETTMKLLQRLRQDLDWAEFCRSLETVGGTSSNVESHAERFAQYLRTTKTQEWWIDLWGAFDDPRKYQFTHEWETLIHSSEQFRKGEIPWGIKCPLFKTATKEICDVPFWIEAIMRPVSQEQRDPGLFVFWNRRPTKVEPCALISLGPGSPNVTRFIVTPEAQEGSWRDLLLGAQGNGGRVLQGQVHFLDDPAMTLERLLDYLSGRA